MGRLRLSGIKVCLQLGPEQLQGMTIVHRAFLDRRETQTKVHKGEAVAPQDSKPIIMEMA